MDDGVIFERPDRRPDALLIPQGYAAGGDVRAKAAAMRREFDPILNGRRWWPGRPQRRWEPGFWMRDPIPLGSYFVTPSIDQQLFFPLGHPLQGRPRYRWWDRGDGVKYGWLVDEAH